MRFNPRQLLFLIALAFAAALASFLLLNHPAQEEAAGLVPPGAGSRGRAASTPARADTAHVESVPAESSAAGPATLPAQEEPSPAQPPAPPPSSMPVDQRQDAKIARGLSVNPEGGLRVDDTPAGSIVDELRLMPGDVIVSVNGEPLATTDDFVRIYRAQGLPTQMVVMREGRELHRH